MWEFDAKPQSWREFERAYGPTGAWAQLFRKGDGYVATELLLDREVPGRYVTIDRWDFRAAFEAFRERFDVEYERLDQACEALTTRETLIGRFEDAAR